MNNLISLKLNKEFKRAYYQGKFKAHPFIVTYMIKNRKPVSRVGITTSKKIGCAVKRNRARRIIRQACREILSENEFNLNGYDLVFVARNETPSKNTEDIKRVIKKHIAFLTKK